jgi:DNA-binding MarR family transcriptional regulator
MESTSRRGAGTPGSADYDLMITVLKQFRVLLRSMDTHYRSVEKRSGLGGAQIWALAEISGNRAITMSELAKRLGIQLSTASNLVKRLEELGLVRRERAAPDQRVVRLAITPAGRRRLKRAPAPSAGLLQQALMGMHRSELDALHAQLGKLLRKMGHLDRRGATTPIGQMLGTHGPARR